MARAGADYIVTFSVMINSAMEENLDMHIDWRDPTGIRTESRDFLTPGVFSVSHLYSFSDFNAFVTAGNVTFNVDFSVSHNQSIQVFGGTVQQGGGPVIVVPGHVLTTTDDPTTGTNVAIPPAQVTDNVLSDTDFHYEDGLVEIKIPTIFLPPIVPDPRPPAPQPTLVAVPNIALSVQVNAVPVEIQETPLSSYSSQSSDYFQLRSFDGATRTIVEKYEHISDEFGELLLQPARLKQWVTDEHLQDQTGLELWLITEKHTGHGAVTVERPVLKFDIANGQPFPARESMPTEFEELKLVPMDLDGDLNIQSSPAPAGTAVPTDEPGSGTISPPGDGDHKRSETDGQSRMMPSNSDAGAFDSDSDQDVTVSSTTSHSLLTSVALAAVLSKSRTTSIAPSKSRRLLNRILNRQR